MYPNFTANIRFISENDFKQRVPKKELERHGKAVMEPWSYKSIVVDKEAVTDAVELCVAGGITHPKATKGMYYHFAPVNTPDSDFPKIADKFKSAVDNLKNVLGEAHSLIIGGYNYLPNSFRVGTFLKKLFNDKNNNTDTQSTIFFGQDTGATEIYHSTKNDTWLVSFEHRKLTSRDKTPSIEDIKAHYDLTKIAGKDKVFIGDSNDPVNPDLLQQSKVEL